MRSIRGPRTGSSIWRAHSQYIAVVALFRCQLRKKMVSISVCALASGPVFSRMSLRCCSFRTTNGPGLVPTFVSDYWCAESNSEVLYPITAVSGFDYQSVYPFTTPYRDCVFSAYWNWATAIPFPVSPLSFFLLLFLVPVTRSSVAVRLLGR